jgi:hypothetical protein
MSKRLTSALKIAAIACVVALLFWGGYETGWRAGRNKAHDEVGVVITEMVKEHRTANKTEGDKP